MEQLNDYLQRLLSTCSEELRLEPDRNPYLVSENRTTDVATVPLLGKQISTMVFPLIPAATKSDLPNLTEVEFVHPHNLGNFNFTVQKSPAGFIVSIRPLLTASNGSVEVPTSFPDVDHDFTSHSDQFDREPESVGSASQFSERSFTTDEPPRFDYQPLSRVDAFPTTVANSGAFDPAFATDDLFSYERPSNDREDTASEFDNTAGTVESEFTTDSHPSFESSSYAREMTAAETVANATIPDLIVEDELYASDYTSTLNNDPKIEVVSAYDPEFQTVFSETATYEPPGKRDEYMNNTYIPEVDNFDYQPSMPPPQAPPTKSTTPVESAQAAFVPSTPNAKMSGKMDVLFRQMAAIGASDLHLSVSVPPMVRKDGKMTRLQEGETSLTAESMRELITSIMPPKNQEEFAARHDTDFAYEIPGLARFRCNVFMDRKGMGGVFRIIPTDILTAEKLGLSKAIMDLCSLSKGLVVVTGPTGSGKSTTLCAMVDSINKTREDHIITIEDPIEFVHENQKCLVNQREVHNHTASFKDALRAALREDPDILLVGEMRDLETISIAIETAETGHLVFGTLHTTTAPSTVDRIIDQFPADRQQQIRVMLSESLKGVIAQTLLPKIGGGRVAALEVLIITPAISNLIREGKTFQIPSAMQTGRNHGMVMLNDSLFEHVKNGVVEPMDAYIKAVDKTGFETMLTRGGFRL